MQQTASWRSWGWLASRIEGFRFAFEPLRNLLAVLSWLGEDHNSTYPHFSIKTTTATQSNLLAKCFTKKSISFHLRTFSPSSNRIRIIRISHHTAGCSRGSEKRSHFAGLLRQLNDFCFIYCNVVEPLKPDAVRMFALICNWWCWTTIVFDDLRKCYFSSSWKLSLEVANAVLDGNVFAIARCVAEGGWRKI